MYVSVNVCVSLYIRSVCSKLEDEAGGDELASRRQCHRLASRLEVSPPALSIGAVTLVWVPVQKHGLLSNAPHSSGGIVSVAL